MRAGDPFIASFAPLFAGPLVSGEGDLTVTMRIPRRAAAAPQCPGGYASGGG